MGLEGIKRISSTASTNFGSVNVEIMQGEDPSELMDKIKVQVDAIDTFPENVEKPTIQKFVGVNPVLTVAVNADADEFTLDNFTEEIKDGLDALPEITLTYRIAKQNQEISIEVSENNLRKYNLTFFQISQAIKNSSINMPSGSIKNSNGEILIRSNNQGLSVGDFAQIPIITRSNGAIVYLSDIANIQDSFENTYDLDILFNSQKSNLIMVYRIGNQNAITISNAVREFIINKNKQLPDGVSITAWDDESIVLRGRINTMTKNAQQGLFLVIIVLTLFLKPKLAFWVSLGIPISFLGGFWFMPLLGLSINMLSLFTFILVLLLALLLLIIFIDLFCHASLITKKFLIVFFFVSRQQ